MERKKMIYSNIIFAILFFQAVSSIEETCILDSNECDASKLGFQEEETYVYKFRSTTKTTNPKNPLQTVYLVSQGNAEITRIKGCKMAVQLKDVVVYESFVAKSTEVDRTNFADLKDQLQKFPMMFQLGKNNQIDGVCAVASDLDVAVNVKKSIISQLQVSIEDVSQSVSGVEESDIMGKCLTNYRPLPEKMTSEKMYFIKTKGINRCQFRHKLYTKKDFDYISTSQYDLKTSMEGEFNCEYEQKKNGLITNVECSQKEHLPQNIYDNDKQLVYDIQQVLSYSSSKKIQPIVTPLGSLRKTNIYFKHGDLKPNHVDKKSRPTSDVLKDLCQAYISQFPDVVASTLMELQTSLQSAKDFSAVYKSIETICPLQSEKIQELFLKLLPYTNSGKAVKYILDTFEAKAETQSIVDRFMLIISIAKAPTVEMITPLETFLADDSKMERALVWLGNLLQSYCKNNKKCFDNKDINRIVTTVVQKITCHKSEQVNAIFRTLATIRQVPDRSLFNTKAEMCLSSSNSEIETKVTVLNAMTVIGSAKSKEILKSVIDNKMEDSEVRAKAYITYMSERSHESFNYVVERLRDEDILQTGSAVWSYLNALLYSKNPIDRPAVMRLSRLSNKIKDLATKFNLPFLKYSRNFKGQINIGKESLRNIFSDYSLTFGSESLFPRSFDLNVNSSTFGNLFNVAELKVRSPRLENFFGPNIKTLLPDFPFLKQGWTDPKVDEDTNKIDSMYKKLDKASLSMHLKMFGKDILYNNFKSMNQMMDALVQYALSGKEIEVNQKVIMWPMQASYSGATLSGFTVDTSVDWMMLGALNLKVQKIGGEHQLTLRPLMNSYRKTSTRINFHFGYNGFSKTNVMFFNPSVRGTLRYNEADVALQLDPVKQTQHIMYYTQDTKLIHNSARSPPSPRVPERPVNNGCLTSAFFKTLTGVQLCWSVRAPASEVSQEDFSYNFTIPETQGFRLESTPQKLYLSTISNDNTYLKIDYMDKTKGVVFKVSDDNKFGFNITQSSPKAYTGNFFYGKNEGNINAVQEKDEWVVTMDTDKKIATIKFKQSDKKSELSLKDDGILAKWDLNFESTMNDITKKREATFNVTAKDTQVDVKLAKGTKYISTEIGVERTENKEVVLKLDQNFVLSYGSNVYDKSGCSADGYLAQLKHAISIYSQAKQLNESYTHEVVGFSGGNDMSKIHDVGFEMLNNYRPNNNVAARVTFVGCPETKQFRSVLEMPAPMGIRHKMDIFMGKNKPVRLDFMLHRSNETQIDLKNTITDWGKEISGTGVLSSSKDKFIKYDYKVDNYFSINKSANIDANFYYPGGNYKTVSTFDHQKGREAGKFSVDIKSSAGENFIMTGEYSLKADLNINANVTEAISKKEMGQIESRVYWSNLTAPFGKYVDKHVGLYVKATDEKKAVTEVTVHQQLTTNFKPNGNKREILLNSYLVSRLICQSAEKKVGWDIVLGKDPVSVDNERQVKIFIYPASNTKSTESEYKMRIYYAPTPKSIRSGLVFSAPDMGEAEFYMNNAYDYELQKKFFFYVNAQNGGYYRRDKAIAYELNQTLTVNLSKEVSSFEVAATRQWKRNSNDDSMKLKIKTGHSLQLQESNYTVNVPFEFVFSRGDNKLANINGEIFTDIMWRNGEHKFRAGIDCNGTHTITAKIGSELYRQDKTYDYKASVDINIMNVLINGTHTWKIKKGDSMFETETTVIFQNDNDKPVNVGLSVKLAYPKKYSLDANITFNLSSKPTGDHSFDVSFKFSQDTKGVFKIESVLIPNGSFSLKDATMLSVLNIKERSLTINVMYGGMPWAGFFVMVPALTDVKVNFDLAIGWKGALQWNLTNEDNKIEVQGEVKLETPFESFSKFSIEGVKFVYEGQNQKKKSVEFKADADIPLRGRWSVNYERTLDMEKPWYRMIESALTVKKNDKVVVSHDIDFPKRNFTIFIDMTVVYPSSNLTEVSFKYNIDSKYELGSLHQESFNIKVKPFYEASDELKFLIGNKDNLGSVPGLGKKNVLFYFEYNFNSDNVNLRQWQHKLYLRQTDENTMDGFGLIDVDMKQFGLDIMRSEMELEELKLIGNSFKGKAKLGDSKSFDASGNYKIELNDIDVGLSIKNNDKEWSNFAFVLNKDTRHLKFYRNDLIDFESLAKYDKSKAKYVGNVNVAFKGKKLLSCDLSFRTKMESNTQMEFSLLKRLLNGNLSSYDLEYDLTGSYIPFSAGPPRPLRFFILHQSNQPGVYAVEILLKLPTEKPRSYSSKMSFKYSNWKNLAINNEFSIEAVNGTNSWCNSSIELLQSKLQKLKLRRVAGVNKDEKFGFEYERNTQYTFELATKSYGDCSLNYNYETFDFKHSHFVPQLSNQITFKTNLIRPISGYTQFDNKNGYKINFDDKIILELTEISPLVHKLDYILNDTNKAIMYSGDIQVDRTKEMTYVINYNSNNPKANLNLTMTRVDKKTISIDFSGSAENQMLKSVKGLVTAKKGPLSLNVDVSYGLRGDLEGNLIVATGSNERRYFATLNSNVSDAYDRKISSQIINLDYYSFYDFAIKCAEERTGSIAKLLQLTHNPYRMPYLIEAILQDTDTVDFVARYNVSMDNPITSYYLKGFDSDFLLTTTALEKSTRLNTVYTIKGLSSITTQVDILNPQRNSRIMTGEVSANFLQRSVFFEINGNHLYAEPRQVFARLYAKPAGNVVYDILSLNASYTQGLLDIRSQFGTTDNLRLIAKRQGTLGRYSSGISVYHNGKLIWDPQFTFEPMQEISYRNGDDFVIELKRGLPLSGYLMLGRIFARRQFGGNTEVTFVYKKDKQGRMASLTNNLKEKFTIASQRVFGDDKLLGKVTCRRDGVPDDLCRMTLSRVKDDIYDWNLFINDTIFYHIKKTLDPVMSESFTKEILDTWTERRDNFTLVVRQTVDAMSNSMIGLIKKDFPGFMLYAAQARLHLIRTLDEMKLMSLYQKIESAVVNAMENNTFGLDNENYGMDRVKEYYKELMDYFNEMVSPDASKQRVSMLFAKIGDVLQFWSDVMDSLPTESSWKLPNVDVSKRLQTLKSFYKTLVETLMSSNTLSSVKSFLLSSDVEAIGKDLIMLVKTMQYKSGYSFMWQNSFKVMFAMREQKNIANIFKPISWNKSPDGSSLSVQIRMDPKSCMSIKKLLTKRMQRVAQLFTTMRSGTMSFLTSSNIAATRRQSGRLLKIARHLTKADWRSIFGLIFEPKTAYVLGVNQIVTFNGEHIFLPRGDCRYLLMRDFETNQFAIYYQQTKKGGFNIILHHAKVSTLEFGPDGQFKMEVDKRDMFPYSTTRGGQVTLQADTTELSSKSLIYLRGSNGLTLTVSPQIGYVKIQLSNTWYGRVGGLVGVNNNEDVASLRTPKMEYINLNRPNGMLDFVRSWRLGPKCNERRLELVEPPSPMGEQYCKGIVTEGSLKSKLMKIIKSICDRRVYMSEFNMIDQNVCLMKRMVSAVQELPANAGICDGCPGFTDGVYKLKTNPIFVLPLTNSKNVQAISNVLQKLPVPVRVITYDGNYDWSEPQFFANNGDIYTPSKNWKYLSTFLKKSNAFRTSKEINSIAGPYRTLQRAIRIARMIPNTTPTENVFVVVTDMPKVVLELPANSRAVYVTSNSACDKKACPLFKKNKNNVFMLSQNPMSLVNELKKAISKPSSSKPLNCKCTGQRGVSRIYCTK